VSIEVAPFVLCELWGRMTAALGVLPEVGVCGLGRLGIGAGYAGSIGLGGRIRCLQCGGYSRIAGPAPDSGTVNLGHPQANGSDFRGELHP